MARKTRKEKVVSDERFIYKFLATPKNTQAHSGVQINTIYAKEFNNTFILTMAILIFQVLLYLGFKKNLISIPGISY